MRASTVLRRSVAGLLIAGAATLGSISDFTDHARVCEDVVPRIGKEALVRSCRPLEPTDTPIIAIGVSVALLLAPDLAEVSIFGVGWKRRIEAAETRQEQLSAKVETVQHALLAANQEVMQVTNIGLTPDQMSEDELQAMVQKLKQRQQSGLGTSISADENEPVRAQPDEGDSVDGDSSDWLEGAPGQEQT